MVRGLSGCFERSCPKSRKGTKALLGEELTGNPYYRTNTNSGQDPERVISMLSCYNDQRKIFTLPSDGAYATGEVTFDPNDLERGRRSDPEGDPGYRPGHGAGNGSYSGDYPGEISVMRK